MIGKLATFTRNLIDAFKCDSCFLRYFSEAFKITNKNIILATPLILFTIIIFLYLFYNPANQLLGVIFLLVVFFAVCAVFLSGWLHTVKLSIESVDESSKDNFYLLKQFPNGVGTHFLTYFLAVAIFFVLFTFLVILSYKSALLLIGSLGISSSDLFLGLSSADNMKNLIMSLSQEQQVRLAYWNLYFFATTTIFSFVLMFWAPEITCSGKNALFSLWISIKNLFKKFFKSLTIFMFLLFIYFIISIASAIFRFPVINFLITVLYFYFLVYSAILIFLFYIKEFNINE